MEIATLGIKVDSSQVKTATGDVENLTRSGKTADDRFKSFTNTLKGVAGALAIGATFRAVISATVEQERVTRQLETVLQSTGNAAGYARDELLDMASELQKVTTFGDEAIISAQTRLLSYSGIVGTNFPRALQNVLDQSARLNISLEQSAEVIGKALEAPQKAAEALSRQGFAAAFTDEVKATIDALVAAGNEAEAQILILEILEESYGGAAVAARDTLGGAIQSLKNAFGDLLEGDGGGEGVQGAKQAIEELINLLEDPNTKAAFGTIIESIVTLVGLAARGAVGFANFGKAIGNFMATAGGTNFGLHDIDGMVEKLSKLQLQMELMRERGDTNTPMFRSIEAEFDRINVQLDLANELADQFGSKPIVTPGQTAGVQNLASNVRILTEEEIRLAKERELAAKAAEKRWEANQRTVESLQLEADTLNMTSSEAKLYELALNGADAAQRAAAESALTLIDAHKAQLEQAKTARALREEWDREQENVDRQAEQIMFQLLTEEQQIAESYERRRQIILDATFETEEERTRVLTQLEAQRQQQMDQMEGAKRAMMLSNYSQLFDGMAGIAKTFQGEQSTIYKAMFVASKAFAIADSVIKIQQGLAGALAMPFPANVFAFGKTLALAAPIVSTIQGTQPPSFDGGGFTGMGARQGGVDGKGGFPAILHPNETVIDHTKGQGVGNNVVVNLIADTSRAGEVSQSEDEDGNMQVDAFVADIFGDGQRARALEAAYGLSRVGR